MAAMAHSSSDHVSLSPPVSSSTRPRALESFHLISSQLSDCSPAMFLDYDGTCTPIVSDPSKAILSDDMRNTIETLSKYFPTAIVTGRKFDTIIQFVRLPELYYAGSHGFDIRSPGGSILKQVAEEFLPALAIVRDQISKHVKDIPGSLVEDNIYSISVHYRNVSASDQQRIHQIVQQVFQANSHNNNTALQLLPGKMVHEIRPQLEWHKGKAVLLLLKSMRETEAVPPRTLAPICMGDDTTDEDAFRALESDPHSVTVLVLPDSGGERQTNAKYVCHQGEVEQFLKQLTTLAKQQ